MALDLSAVTRAALGSVARENLGEKVEQLVASLPADRINSPEKWWDVVIAMLVAIPQPLRTFATHTIAAVIKTESGGKIPEIVKMTVPAVLESTDTGLIRLVDDARIDKPALRAKLVELFKRDHPEGTAGAPAASGAHKPGTTGLTFRDGGITAHLIGNVGCVIAQGSMNESGSDYVILSRSGIGRCTKCYPDVVVKTTVAPPAGPAKGKTVVDILLEDKAGDGHIGRALAAFNRIVDLRTAELIDEPRRVWHLRLMHEDGLPLEPSALGLLPTITEAEVTAFNDAGDRIRAAHDASIATPVADLRIVLDMVRRFDPYIAEIRLLAEQDVNDVWEWAAKGIDLVDDRITARQREWILHFFRDGWKFSIPYPGRVPVPGSITGETRWGVVWYELAETLPKPVMIALAIAALYLFTLAGSAVAGFIAWVALLGITSVFFFTGGFLELGAFALIMIGLLGMGVHPVMLVAIIVGWFLIVLSRVIGVGLDHTYQKVRNALRGVIPGYEEGWFIQVFRKGGDFARSKGWLPPVTVTVEKVPLTSIFWLDIMLLFSVAAGLIGIVGSVMYLSAHFTVGGMVVVAGASLLNLIVTISDLYRRLVMAFPRAGRLIPEAEQVKDALAAKNAGLGLLRLAAWGFGVVSLLAICSGIATSMVSTWIGDGNVATAQEASRTGSQAVADSWYQEACEAAALCEPEHYPNETWAGYCEKYPLQSDCQIRARRARQAAGR